MIVLSQHMIAVIICTTTVSWFRLTRDRVWEYLYHECEETTWKRRKVLKNAARRVFAPISWLQLTLMQIPNTGTGTSAMWDRTGITGNRGTCRWERDGVDKTSVSAASGCCYTLHTQCAGAGDWGRSARGNARVEKFMGEVGSRVQYI